jgi:hypothetical protein
MELDSKHATECAASSVAVSKLMPKETHTHTWILHGVTPAALAAFKAGEEIYSDPFMACGREWFVVLSPNGRTGGDAGHVCAALVLNNKHGCASPATEWSVAIGNKVKHCGHKDNANAFRSSGREPQRDVHVCVAAHADVPLAGDALALIVTISVHNEPFHVVECLVDGGEEGRNALALDLKRAFDSGEGADVELVCGDSRVRAHSQVLGIRSPVFLALLARSKTGRSGVAELVVPEAEVQPVALARLLEFIYTNGMYPPVTAEEAPALLAAAEYYGVEGLKMRCERALLVSMNVDRAVSTLVTAELYARPSLWRAALLYAARNSAEVMCTPGWAELKEQRPHLVDAMMVTLATGAPPTATFERRVRRRIQDL